MPPGQSCAGVELDGLELDQARDRAFIADARVLVDRYFELENPDAVRAVGLELKLSTELNGVTVRGIIDRLDELEDGSLAVVDYKTGRAPRLEHSRSRLSGVQMYALMCEAELGRRPAVVRLLYLRDRVVISAAPTDQAMRGTRQRALGVWSAIERACAKDDFRPNPSSLCRYCAFQAYCPSFGGDPALAGVALGSPSLPAQPTAVPDWPGRSGSGGAGAGRGGLLGLMRELVGRSTLASTTSSRPLRGNRIADRVFYSASALGDFGLLWLALGLLRILRSRPGDTRAGMRAVIATGIESVVVNAGMKSLFRGDDRGRSRRTRCRSASR